MYTEEFYHCIDERSTSSAQKIVPLVLNLLEVKNVIDFGCGTGSWLSVFNGFNVASTGVDGSYVDRSSLKIPSESFIEADLSKPFRAGRNFDLVMSLEVAEHIGQEFADTFVETLVAHGPVILFSAAVPHQPGVNHINGQWPTYWAAKFKRHEYACIDCLRPEIWFDEDIEYWYRQNIFLYVREGELKDGKFSHLTPSRADRPLDLVHPGLYAFMVDEIHKSRQLSMQETLNNLSGTKLLRLCLERLLARFGRSCK